MGRSTRGQRQIRMFAVFYRLHGVRQRRGTRQRNLDQQMPGEHS